MPITGQAAFNQAIDRQIAEVRPAFADRMVQDCAKLFEKPASKMPVDTGTALASLRIGIDAPDLSVAERSVYQDPRSIAHRQLDKLQALFSNPFRKVWVTDALPYIPALEYGHSLQAPAGMFRVSAAEMESEINR